MIIRLFCLASFISFSFFGLSQSEEEKEYLAEYNKRIKLSRIDEVYIPKNIEDAFAELKQLSEPAGIEKFKSAPEGIVAARLKGGIGKWMLINWGLFEGSRLSHYLKSMGVHHPEDMVSLLLVSFHRNLNNKPLQIEDQATTLQEARKTAYEATIIRDTTILKQ